MVRIALGVGSYGVAGFNRQARFASVSEPNVPSSTSPRFGMKWRYALPMAGLLLAGGGYYAYEGHSGKQAARTEIDRVLLSNAKCEDKVREFQELMDAQPSNTVYGFVYRNTLREARTILNTQCLEEQNQGITPKIDLEPQNDGSQAI